MEKIDDFLIKLPFCYDKIKENMFFYLNYFQLIGTAQHSLEVAQEAEILADKFGLNPQKAYVAGLLHDIGGVVPDESRVILATELHFNIFEEDKHLPLLLHQNFSAYIAKEHFGIEDEQILSSMACHTTLKPGATEFDKLIFISDKLKWDNKHSAPYFDEVLNQLDISLDKGCLAYFDWLFEVGMPIIHPYTQQAYDELKLKYQ
ncbi:bis(5'-nucleosyl)-tetraphosphatase (symmetrical) YqeK [Vagococcus silagei]|nr:bis(5'-nucleosyl)-tetraphosphatase (symmetrical) YqeK [Vagococcus silagei]